MVQNENNRILDKFLKFKLVEVDNNIEGEDLLTASSYNDIRNKSGRSVCYGF